MNTKAQSVLAKLKAKGQPATITKQTSTVETYVLPVTAKTSPLSSISQVNTSTVIVPALPFALTIDANLKIDGQRFTIKKISTIKEAGSLVFYRVEVVS